MDMDQRIPSSSVHLDIHVNSSKNNNTRKYHINRKLQHFKCKRRARALSEEEITDLIYRRIIDHQNNNYRHLSTIISKKFQKLQQQQQRLSSKMRQEQLNRRDQNVQSHASLTIQQLRQQRQRHQRRSIEHQHWIQQQQQVRRQSHEYHTNYNDIEMMMISDDNDDDLKEKLELLHMHDIEEMNWEDRPKQEQLNQLEEMFSFKMETSTE